MARRHLSLVDSTPAHGVLQRPGAKPQLDLTEVPAWHTWPIRSEATRAARWITAKLVIPSGAGAGQPFRLARFQRTILDDAYGGLAAFECLPTGNGKTGLLAAIALERICRGDHYVEVDVVATKEDQAGMVLDAARRMVECVPELVGLCAFHSKDGILEYRPTGSVMVTHPAKLTALQGLNFTLGLVDEVGFARDDHVEALLARLGKRPDAHLLGVGTPGFDPNVLFRIRSQAIDGSLPAGLTYREWSAPEGCEVSDKQAWRVANPAIAAGFLRADALALQAEMMPERTFRVYHLGQWVELSAAWLPAGRWDACPEVPPPADGAEVVIAVEGTYKRSIAVVGCGLDGSLFMVWTAESATDAELRAVLDACSARWEVVEVVHPKRVRVRLFAETTDAGMPCRPWPGTPDVEAASANDLYRAILEARIAHDHDPVIAEHVAHLQTRMSVDGSIRLVRPDSGDLVDAALAARAAWWRAGELAANGLDPGPPTIY